jgi:ABC-2 type transport system permease protein
LYVINTLNFFVSGHMFPLDLLSPFWVWLFKLMPFQYLAYFPAAVFLGKIEGAGLLWGLAGEAAWALGLIVLSRWLYQHGLKRYSAYGG